MTVDHFFIGVRFVPLDGSGQKFFGFSEFLAGLALMILAWTIADVRYRFRVRTAPVPLMDITLYVVTSIGVLTLLTDLWRAEQWLVPAGKVLTASSWQALMGGLFFLTFLTWTWFAFIRPPKFGRYNAEEFARTLYRFILNGSPEELAVIANELAYSAEALVCHATDRDFCAKYKLSDGKEKKKQPTKVERYANDLLLLIADKRLCRAIVGSSPGTALAFFQAIGTTKRYGIQIETFAKNIVNEAIKNKDSFLYHEIEGYESGLIGYYKPLSQAMFSNYKMVEAIEIMLDPDIYSKSEEWDAEQWEAYCRVVLMTFRNYVEEGVQYPSTVLYRAKGYIENASADLYSLNGLTNNRDNNAIRRLNVVVKFIGKMIEILDKKGVPANVRRRVKEGIAHETFYDHIASMIFEVILHASHVRSPRWECWSIQYSAVWGRFFNFHQCNCPAGKIVKFKVRRLLYDEIVRMKVFPNFKGSKLLGFCLNVMGFSFGPSDHDKDSRALQQAILHWTRKNYIWLHQANPRVAEDCLVDGITYDIVNQRLVHTTPAEGLRLEPSFSYLELDGISSESKLKPKSGRARRRMGSSSRGNRQP